MCFCSRTAASTTSQWLALQRDGSMMGFANISSPWMLKKRIHAEPGAPCLIRFCPRESLTATLFVIDLPLNSITVWLFSGRIAPVRIQIVSFENVKWCLRARCTRCPTGSNSYGAICLSDEAGRLTNALFIATAHGGRPTVPTLAGDQLCIRNRSEFKQHFLLHPPGWCPRARVVLLPVPGAFS